MLCGKPPVCMRVLTCIPGNDGAVGLGSLAQTSTVDHEPLSGTQRVCLPAMRTDSELVVLLIHHAVVGQENADSAHFS